MLYTVGHSNHHLKVLIGYLKQYGVDAIFDVRSHPYSRFYPQYRYKTLRASLEREGIRYFFYGKELGARINDPDCLVRGRVDFRKLAATRLFRDGIKSLLADIKSYNGCLLCAEKDPLACHRTILVCRHLSSHQISIRHILADGSAEDHQITEKRLMHMHQLDQLELFADPQKQLDRAYDIQGKYLAGL